ncbi:MAG TPA: ABC transporter substrate-binding protein, partial [Actinomycetes bacterium]|nr:ABC transporter substrate-binding protein [Actinomycetes bacterium]
MSRPRTESEYLASLVPPSVAAAGISRRGFLKGTLGTGAALSLSSLLAACGGGGDGDGGSGSKEVTFGSNQSDEVPKKAYAEMTAAFQKSSGLTVKTNTVEHETFQENINNYLQGNPDDVFTWFAGYRMRFFAAQGLAGDISDVWGGISGMSEAMKAASTGEDGKQYFVPLTTYPWGLFYRKSVWEEKGYQPP